MHTPGIVEPAAELGVYLKANQDARRADRLLAQRVSTMLPVELPFLAGIPVNV